MPEAPRRFREVAAAGKQEGARRLSVKAAALMASMQRTIENAARRIEQHGVVVPASVLAERRAARVRLVKLAKSTIAATLDTDTVRT